MSGIALAPLVVDIKANLAPFSTGIDSASRKGTEFQKNMNGVTKELKLAESGFKVTGASAELLGDKTLILANKQRELTEKMKLQSKAIDINKNAYTKTEEKLQKYITQNEKLKSSIDKTTKEHEKAEKTYGKEAEQTKKLADKLSKLNDKLGNNKERIEATNDKLDKQKIKLNEWQTELIQSQKELNKTNTELKNIKLDEIGDKAKKASEGLKSMGSTLNTHVTLPLLAAGTAAVKVGMDFEAKMSRVKAISGATEEQFKTLTDQALKLGQETAFSASECAEGMENLASAGFNVNETTEAMPGLLDLAASSGEDLARSSEIAAGTLRAFGLEASKTGHVADVLAKNAADTNAAVNDTGEALKYIAPVAHTAGLKFEEVSAAIGVMADNNIKGSQAGTTLRGALSRLMKPTESVVKGMKMLNFQAYDSHGKMKSLTQMIGELRKGSKKLTEQQKQEAFANLFGTEALSGMLALVDAGPQKLNDLTNGLESCDGSAKEMAKTMQDNTKASIEQAGGALETASIKMLNIVAPAIKDIADDVGDLADSFSNLTPETQQLILKFGATAIAAGPLLSITGKLTGGFGKLVDLTKGLNKILTTTATATKATTLATEGLSAATTASGAASGVAALSLGSIASVALPLVGVIGAVAGGVYLYTKNTQVMSSTCLQSKEDLGLVGNALLALNGQYALTTDEMDKMNIKHKDWSEKVSPETQKALTEVSDKIANYNFAVEHASSLGKLADKKEGAKLNRSLDEIINGAIAKIKEKSPKIQKEMAEAFKADDGKLDEDEKAIMKFLNKSQSEQIKKVKELKDQILKIKNKAKKQGGKLTQEQIEEEKKLMEKVGEIDRNYTVKNNDELIATKANFIARMNNLDMNGVSNLLQEKAKARDKEVKIQSEKYDTLIQDLKLREPLMDEETRKHAERRIQKLIEAKNKAVGTEREKYKGFLDEAKKKYPELANYIDESNGKILDKTQKTKKKELKEYVKELDGLDKVTKSGYYKVYNNVTGSMQNCYVQVDDSTGQIVELWDQKTGEILGKPIKAKDDIKNELRNGQISFNPIVTSYNGKKDEVEKNPVKPKSEVNNALFDWVKTTWDNTIGYIAKNPIAAAVNWVTHGALDTPSHRYNGLDYVPFDGYLARLHKGERIMTADENANYSKGNRDIQVTNNFYGRIDSPYEVYKATRRSWQELRNV